MAVRVYFENHWQGKEKSTTYHDATSFRVSDGILIVFNLENSGGVSLEKESVIAVYNNGHWTRAKIIKDA